MKRKMCLLIVALLMIFGVVPGSAKEASVRLNTSAVTLSIGNSTTLKMIGATAKKWASGPGQSQR